MKICIVGPGVMPIPPKGWGAVEILIDDYRKTLETLGHEVHIVNTRDLNLLVWMVNNLNADFVHIQYDEFVNIIPYIQCKNIAITSHYGYLEQPNRWDPGYVNIFWGFVNSTAKIFCLSPGIADVYLRAGVPSERVVVIPNGVRTDLFRFDESCKYPDESIYLAKIDPRKRQAQLQNIPGIKFVGNYADPSFDRSDVNYLGEWSKDTIYENLTNFANLILLSDGEAHPLVCLEAMSAGLGLVISEVAKANLDLSLPFIDVIPEDKINDTSFIKDVIRKNRQVSIEKRKEIKKYAETFDWNKIVSNLYLSELQKS
jgi:glycosyltransferase involved in cell wall biosynthesis